MFFSKVNRYYCICLYMFYKHLTVISLRYGQCLPPGGMYVYALLFMKVLSIEHLLKVK